MTLLDRTIAAADRRLVLLAPEGAYIPESFATVGADAQAHAGLLESVQRLRGRVYLEDGAIAPEALSRGLHKTPEDEQSWHLVSLNAVGEVVACAWYRLYDAAVSFNDLRVRKSPLANTPGWGDRLWHAIETDLLRARTDGLGFAELGGWAITKTNRCTSEVLLLACGAYALSQALGGALGLTTATVRHSSAKILRRLGGSRVELNGSPGEVPPYFDPHYGCMMELLRFDSRRPHGDIFEAVGVMRQKLASVPVLVNDTCVAVGRRQAEAIGQYA